MLLYKEQDLFMRGATQRGSRLFELAARLLGIRMSDQLENSAQSFAAADLGRRGILDLVPLKLGRAKVRVARNIRPLTVLAVLARRDMRSGPPFESEGTPARAWALLRHRMTGRL
jgi:hypothetical protein